MEKEYPQYTGLDDKVQQFIEYENAAEDDSDRELKLDNIIENRTLRRDFFRPLAKDKQLKRFKDTFLIQTSRRYTEDGSYIPKPFAKARTKEQQVLGVFAESVVETQYNWAELNLVYDDGFEASKTDSDFALWIKYKSGVVVPELINIADVVVDPHCTNFNAFPGTYSAYAWIILKRRYSFDDGIEEANRLSGRDMSKEIKPGSPVATIDSVKGSPIVDKDKIQETRLETEDIHFRYAYDVKDGMLYVYAGSNGALVLKESIKFKTKDKRGRPIKVAPLVFFGFSREKIGPYSLSLFDMCKDISENYREVMDKAFLHFKKVVNPLIFLFTDAGAEMLDQIELAYQNQEYGSPPTVLAPATDNTSVKTVAPESVLGQLREYRALAQEDLASRLGQNMQQQANVKQTYSEYREKNDIEVVAIANYVQVNQLPFSRVAQYTLDMEREYGDRNNKEEVEVKIPLPDGQVENVTITYGEALTLLDDYKGTFDVDTNVKLPTSRSEQVFALNEITNIIFAQIGNMALTDMKIARPIIDITWQKMQIRDLDEVIDRKTLEEFFEAIIARNLGQMQQQMQPQPPTQQQIGNDLGLQTSEQQPTDGGGMNHGNPEQL